MRDKFYKFHREKFLAFFTILEQFHLLQAQSRTKNFLRSTLSLDLNLQQLNMNDKKSIFLLINSFSCSIFNCNCRQTRNFAKKFDYSKHRYAIRKLILFLSKCLMRLSSNFEKLILFTCTPYCRIFHHKM